LAAPVADGIRVIAQPWIPTWLATSADPAAAAFAERPRRSFGPPAPGDPFLKKLGHDSYLAAGQREPVRAALTAPPGATLLAVLPTGAGKTTIIHALAAADARPGTVCVVVPTVALALDQDRRARSFAAHPTAYVGGQSDANAQILSRIEGGTQGVVFAAPEALSGLLGRVVASVAEKGLIRALVVDEAHLAAAWGDSFRPAFQDVAGLRQQLVGASPDPFPTVLLSATVTPATRETLRAFFSGPGPFRTLAALQLRPEPSYWIAEAPSRESRAARVLEALAHLPRPAILYVTRKSDVAGWRERLLAAGYRRFATLTGDDSAATRRNVLEAWRDRKKDLIVATSAFGLGVDQSDVRAVVHACLPESIDRFYQEVGRGGRDGRASVSLLVHTPSDHKLARDLAVQSMVTTEMALGRWTSMFSSAESLGNDRYRVSLDAEHRLDIEGDYNRRWNLRTLNLMAHAGLIRLEGDGSQDGADESTPGRIVQVLDPRHTQASVWNEVVLSKRQQIKADGQHGLDEMVHLIGGQSCVADVLASAYALPNADGDRGARVATACGGCPAHHEPLPTEPLPVPLPPWTVPGDHDVNPRVAVLLRPSGVPYAVFYNSRTYFENLRDLARAIVWCVRHGATALFAPQRVLDVVLPDLKNVGRPVFAETTFQAFRAPARPAVVVVAPGDPIPATGSRPTLLFVPEDTAHPSRPDRPAADVWNGPHDSLDVFSAQRGL
jgi:superfamily II DNA/RNA helicase